MELDPAACHRAFAARDARFDGRVFAGVRTTGIYCRPVCPARTPKPGNMRFFPSAAAAQEAGFRPCLRCRPESAPDLGAWRGTSASVTRALALIEAGGLDAADVETLAGRLGLGGRQLRRLFRQHVGASPVAVAQTRRVLLAKQLLQETRLPMTSVALASGFGSVRRFNETFQTLFDRPPGAIRRGGAATSTGDGAVTLRLPARAPFDWDALADYFAARAIDGLERAEPLRIARLVETEAGPGLVDLKPLPGSAVQATLHLPALSALPGLVARIRRVLDLSADPESIGAHLSGDPLLAPLVAARPGLRVPGAWDGFELAVRAVTGQQVTLKAATALAARVCDLWGRRVALPAAQALGLDRLFPDAATMARADLSALPMPGARRATLQALARAVADDPGLLAPAADLDTAIARLTALPGIGPWTAHYIALRALREPDALPAADAGLMQAIARLGGERPDARAITARAEAWRPWRAYGVLHLWASLGDPRPGDPR